MRINIYRITPYFQVDAAIENWAVKNDHELIIQLAGVASPPELFEIDLLVMESELAEEPEWLQEIRRAGRSVVVLAGKTEEELVAELEAASELPRSNYQPIDCGYYDYFEAAIVQRRAVELRYLLPDGQERRENTQLRNLKTAQSEEFVQLADGRWLRLDRIRELDGIVNTGEVCLISP
ncbi:MAG: hypothetical protein AAF433_04660 [Bacteroidota bacterium]